VTQKGITVPQFGEGERAVLGAMILDEKAVETAQETLSQEDFYHERHRIMFRAALSLVADGMAVDFQTMTAELLKAQQLEKVGGVEYLTGLIDSTPSAANVSHYCEIVKEKSLRRRLIGVAHDTERDATNETMHIDDAISGAERNLFALAERRHGVRIVDMRTLSLAALAHISALHDRRGAVGFVTGAPSGFHDLDVLTAGFQASDLIIVAGRPSMGKTAFALNVAVNAARDADVKSVIFSLEMSAEQLALRTVCGLAQVNMRSVVGAQIADADIPKLVAAAETASRLPMLVDDTPGLSPTQIRSACRRAKREHDIGLVVIDYIQLMSSSRRADSREQEVSEISRSLKALAKELNVPVIALSQLNRKVEDRTDKRPQMSDLRESGAIEQDADLILFIYRDEVYNKSLDNPKRGRAEIIIGKQRNGPTGSVEVAFAAQYTTFRPLARRDEYAGSAM
jgi:replicative DNA helicase